MDITTILLVSIPAAIWLWLSFIGTIAARFDSTLDPFQKKAQIIIVWLIPFIGASLIIFLVNQHSPEVIPRNLIPWPFKNLIFGKPRARNKDRDNNEESGIDLAISDSQHSHTDYGGGANGGGSD
jgi:ABC-type iron transport system FetAB permease component